MKTLTALKTWTWIIEIRGMRDELETFGSRWLKRLRITSAGLWTPQLSPSHERQTAVVFWSLATAVLG